MEPKELRGFEWAGQGDKDRRGPQVIQISGEVEDDMVQGVAEQTALARAAGQKEVLVYINSGGGSVHAALAILNIFSTCGMKVVTCVTGCAASAACVILTAGKERYAAPNSVCMIHDVSLGIFTSMKSEDLAAEARETKRLWRQLCYIMAHNCGHENKRHFYELVRSRKNVDCYIAAEDALHKHKLVTHIGMPRFHVKIKVHYSIKVDKPPKPVDTAPMSEPSDSGSDDSSVSPRRKRARK